MTSIGRQVLNKWVLLAVALAAVLAAVLAMQPVAAQDSTIEYAENGTDPVATFTADDPEGSTSITWSLATPAQVGAEDDLADADNADVEHFDISEDGKLTFDIGGDGDDATTGSVSPDYEAPRGAVVPADTTAEAANTYRVVVAAADNAETPATGYHKVAVKVTNVDEAGVVTWTVDHDADDTADTPKLVQFQVGARLVASVTDGDISGTEKNVQAASALGTPGATAPIWRWYRSPSKTSDGTLIDGETSATYNVSLDDVGMYLRVVAQYVVTGNVDQEPASLTSDYAVLAARLGGNELEFDPAAVSREVAEGDKGRNVGAPVTATDNHGAVNYVLTGTDADQFEIDGKTGQITTKEDLNYESDTTDTTNQCDTPNECSVTVTATDASGDASDPVATVTIKITDVDEKPTFTEGAETVSVAENSEEVRADSDTDGDNDSDDAANPYTATDPEGRTLTYHLMGPDGARFALSSSRNLSFSTAPDYEMPADANRDNVYEVSVRASDGTMYADRMVRVTVTEVNEAPAVMGRDSVNFAENGTGNVATFTADDPEGSTSITWGIAPDEADPDDAGPLAATDAVDGADFMIDDEDGTLKFNIATGEGGPAPDFENGQGSGTGNNTYNLVVSASDGAQTGYHKITVKVTNVNELGEVTWTVDPDGTGPLTTGILDTTNNTPILQFQVGAVLTASAEDGDISGNDKSVGTDETPTWRWYRGGTLISGANTNVYTVGLADARSTIRVIVTYRVGGNTNQENASLTSTYPVLSARVADNALKFDPVTVSREVAEGDEGARVGAPVTATGNHGVVNYTLAGTDANRFEIDQKTGQITTTADLNYEAAATTDNNCATQNECSVTVRATDASGAATAASAGTNIFVDATVTIKITDVDEKPTFASADPAIGMTAISVAEGNTVLDATTPANVTYAATDQDGLNVNLTLMGADAARFTLSSSANGSVLSFRTAPDYEMPGDANRDNVYEVTVRASDGTMHADRMVRVTVTNVNEAPVIIAGGVSISGPASRNYAENGTDEVGTYTARGENAANARWTLEGADMGDFILSASSGETTMLSFRSPPNFEAPADADTDNVYMVTVKVTANGDEDSQDVTVTVTDEEETEDTLLERHDANDNGKIDRDEVLDAIDGFFATPQTATREEVLDLIDLFFEGLSS